MTVALSPRVYHYLALVCLLLGAFGLSGRIELLLFAAPFVVALVWGVALRPASGGKHEPVVRQAVEPPNGFESDAFDLHVDIVLDGDDADDADEGRGARAGDSVIRPFGKAVSRRREALVEAVTPLPRDATIVSGSNHVVASLAAAGPRSFHCRFSIATRRAVSVGPTILRRLDASGCFTEETLCGDSSRVLVFPRPEQLDTTVRPSRTSIHSGDFASRDAGEGMEPATVRPMAGGDRLASINWRATAKHDEPYVNRFVVERSADVVLLLDVYPDPEGTQPEGAGLLDRSVRAAASVAYHYLRRQNRVGLVEIGFHLRYLQPSIGVHHWYRLLARLAEVRVIARQIGPEISSIPSAVLPAGALVIACSSLVSVEFDAVLLDLESRGLEVVLLYAGGAAEPGDERPTSAVERAADRILARELEDRMDRLARAGVHLVVWDPTVGLEGALRRAASMRGYRR